jgi:DNA-binding XRE family transcriptional regulator
MSKKKAKKTSSVVGAVLKITLDDVLKKKGITGYKFAKEYLKVQPNSLTPIRKEGYDPKLSTLIRWAKILNCDVNDLFEVEGYPQVMPATKTKAAS